MSTNLFKETDQAESIYKTVGMERRRRKKPVLCFFCLCCILTSALGCDRPTPRAELSGPSCENGTSQMHCALLSPLP